MNKYLVTLLILFFALSGCQENENVKKKVIKPVKIMQVERSSGLLDLTFPGTVRASKRAELSFNIPGRIIVLNAKEGNEFTKGDIIAELDDSDFKNKYQSAKANLKMAELTFERYRNLIKEEAVSKASVDKAEEAYEIAEANMKVVEKALNDTQLKAFFSGKISASYVENFQNIQAKQPIVSIEDKSVLEIVINIPERGLAKTNREDVVSMYASFEVIPGKKFALNIKEISQKADPATRTYAIVFTMSAPQKYNILAGMTANVDVQVNTRKDTTTEMTLVPVTAVMGDKENNSYVWIYSGENNTVSRRKVIIGKMTGVNIHIVSGLNLGETIVTAGVNYLVEGMKVKPLSGKIGE